MNFLDFSRFSRIYFDFNPFKNGKKGVLSPQEPRADVAWCGTRVDATW